MDNQRYAILHAAQKAIVAELKQYDFEAGITTDISGQSLTVTFGEAVTVSRSLGEDGEGHIFKKATQDLYGYGVWCLFLKRLQLFHQADYIKKILMSVWVEVVRNRDKKVEIELKEIDPELNEFIEQLKAMPGPKRQEDSPKIVTKNKPTFTISKFKEAA